MTLTEFVDQITAMLERSDAEQVEPHGPTIHVHLGDGSEFELSVRPLRSHIGPLL